MNVDRLVKVWFFVSVCLFLFGISLFDPHTEFTKFFVGLGLTGIVGYSIWLLKGL